jgi:hypothetical protein
MARFIRILSAVARESHDVGRSGGGLWLDTGGPCGVFRPNLGARSARQDLFLSGYWRKPLKI